MSTDQAQIFVTERRANDSNSSQFHTGACLAYLHGEQITLKEQIDFDGGLDRLVIPRLKRGISDPEFYPDRYKDLMFSKVCTPKSNEDALKQWIHGLKYGFRARALGLQFTDPSNQGDSINCRSMVKDMLRSMGIETTSADYASDRGLSCTTIPHIIKNFDGAKGARHINSLEQDRVDRGNALMTISMPNRPQCNVGDLPAGRSLQPLSHPLKPMARSS